MNNINPKKHKVHNIDGFSGCKQATNIGPTIILIDQQMSSINHNPTQPSLKLEKSLKSYELGRKEFFVIVSNNVWGP
jgi:hypothetical protein